MPITPNKSIEIEEFLNDYLDSNLDELQECWFRSNCEFTFEEVREVIKNKLESIADAKRLLNI
jgi:hypothetical protein